MTWVEAIERSRYKTAERRVKFHHGVQVWVKFPNRQTFELMDAGQTKPVPIEKSEGFVDWQPVML